MQTLAPTRFATDLDPERRLLAGAGTPGRALLGTDPALGDRATSQRPVLLLEPVDAFSVIDPVSGQAREMQAEVLVRQGFQRIGLEGAAPYLPGWTIGRRATQLQVRDDLDELWAYTSIRPGPDWLAAAAEHGAILVVYGALVGVRAPRGIRAAQYGPRQRAAELHAGCARGFVAAAILDWRPRT